MFKKFKTIFKKKENISERKKILVVCSDSRKLFNSDFRDPKNKSLKLNLFGIDPNYIFCNERRNNCTFPDNISDNNFDAIWFAGCNLSNWIIKDNVTILKIIKILKPNGFIVFTEHTDYKTAFGGDTENNLTVPFDFLVANSIRIMPSREHENELMFDFFNGKFEKRIDKNNYTIYTIKELISCNNDDECKIINNSGTCEDDNYCYFDSSIGGYKKSKNKKLKSKKSKSKKLKSKKSKSKKIKRN